MYASKPQALTIEGVSEPEAQPPQPPGPRRTPHGDALAFGPAAALVLALVAIGGHALALPPLWWAVVTGMVALAACAVARLAAGATAVTAWWAVTFTTAGAWLAWARFANIKTPAPWLWLGGSAVILAAAWPLVMARAVKAGQAERRRAAELERQREENRWPELLTRTGHRGVAVTGREDTRSGYVLGLKLPGSGRVTYSQLANDRERLEVAARMRHGSLRFERGPGAHEVLLFVNDRDVLAETVPYVDDGHPLSIRNPIPIGLYEDGEVCRLTLREVCLLIVGLRGAGKSNLLNVLIAQLVRCVDALLFVCDTKHRLVMPWVAPYLADRANGMAIDWVATGRSETELMLRATLAGIRARAASLSGGEKLTPTPHEPAVVLIVDEVASIFGQGLGPRTSAEGTTNSTLVALGTEAVQLGRSEAIDLVLATQRGTVTMVGSGDLKSQCQIRIGLRVTSEADARSVIPDDTRAAQLLATLTHEGTGLVEDRDSRPAPVKFFRIEPQQIPAIARRYGPLKPGPEEVLERALGAAYETRWDRFRAGRRAATAAATATVDTDAEFEAIAERLADVDAVDGGTATAARQRMRRYMQHSGERGVTVGMIAALLASEHMSTSERTIRRWLAEDALAGHAERTTRGLWRHKS